MFSEKHVQAAIERLPTMSTADIRALKEKAIQHDLSSLQEACDRELAVRPIAFSASDAEGHARMAEQVQDLDLTRTIAIAFSKVAPASDVERELLSWIDQHPGATYQEAVAMRGKGDVGLLVGHLIYERFGCFRRFVRDGEDLSSLLLHKDRSGPSVRYTLTAEAIEGLREAGVLS